MASNKLLKANRRLKIIVLFSWLAVDLRPASRRDAAHTSLTMGKPSQAWGRFAAVRRGGDAVGEADARANIPQEAPVLTED